MNGKRRVYKAPQELKFGPPGGTRERARGVPQKEVPRAMGPPAREGGGRRVHLSESCSQSVVGLEKKHKNLTRACTLGLASITQT